MGRLAERRSQFGGLAVGRAVDDLKRDLQLLRRGGGRVGRDGPHSTRFLAPRWLEKHEPKVGDASAFAGADAVCSPGQQVGCADSSPVSDSNT